MGKTMNLKVNFLEEGELNQFGATLIFDDLLWEF